MEDTIEDRCGEHIFAAACSELSGRSIASALPIRMPAKTRGHPQPPTACKENTMSIGAELRTSRLTSLAVALLAVTFIILSCSWVDADPVGLNTVTISFTVSGANGSMPDSPIDPVFGTATASGTVSFPRSLIPIGGGQLLVTDTLSSTGLGASQVAFSWAGFNWSTANADLFWLSFDARGALLRWGLGGFPAGIAQVGGVVPDFAISVAADIPNLHDFDYTTADSTRVGVFTGTVAGWTVSDGPSPTPEPSSLMLLGAGLLAVVGLFKM